MRWSPFFLAVTLSLGCDPRVETVASAPTAAASPSAVPPASRAAAPAATAPAGPAEAAGVRYLERVVGGVPAGTRLPMIIAIHGLGDDPAHFVQLFSGLVGVRARLIVPYGEQPYQSGFSWFPVKVPLDPEASGEGAAKAARRLVAMMDALTASRPTAGKPIVTGFSQGGILSYALAVLAPDRIGQAIPLCGLLPPSLVPVSWPEGVARPPVHALHGDADRVVPIAADRRSLADLQRLGFPADLSEYPGVDHTVTPVMSRDLYAALAAAARAAAP